MAGKRPLTDIAHEGWEPYLFPGALVLDATAGNGFDTAFLTHAIQPNGRIWAIDIQEAALDSTRETLFAKGLMSDNVTLIQGNHAKMETLLYEGPTPRLDFICFNLGYLPNGDHDFTTKAETTIQALNASLRLLKQEGTLSVIAYRGHPGAQEEAQAVDSFFNNLPAPWRTIAHIPTGTQSPGPVWYMASGKKRK